MKLKDKVAIITGGGTGIGKAIAIAYAREGAKVIVASRNISTLEEVVKQINSFGGEAIAIKTDITIQTEVKRLVEQSVAKFNQIDILVNNSAASVGKDAYIVDMDVDDWNRTLAVNLTGTMLCTKEVLKIMMKRQTGCIINMSSASGMIGHPMRSAYCVSKWGIIGFTETLAIEAGKFNIRANCISPAATNTERFQQSMENRAKSMGITYQELMSRFLKQYSLQRIAETSEIAAVAVFLASDDASAITGQNIPVNCGYHILSTTEIG